jgi:hypothetical protein
MNTNEEMMFIEAECPNRHRFPLNCTPSRLRELLDSGTLMFYCYHCDKHFPPTLDAVVSLRRQVALA